MRGLDPLRQALRRARTPETPAPSAKPIPKPVIEVKWDTARRYSYQAQEENSSVSLSNRPKGWDLTQPGADVPPHVRSVKRQGDDGDIETKFDKERTPLSHLIMEVGPGEVQGRLSYKPLLVRPPSDLERQVMEDFSAAMREATQATQGRQNPRLGEFIATYSKATDIETGKLDAVRTAFSFRDGATIPVPSTGSRPDFVIHSHPYDPADPGKHLPGEPLGGDFPSGADRHLAIGQNVPVPPVQMMMHGGRAFLIHEGDLHFSLLDPAATGRKFFADPNGGHAWDQTLFLTPHPTPPPKLP